MFEDTELCLEETVARLYGRQRLSGFQGNGGCNCANRHSQLEMDNEGIEELLLKGHRQEWLTTESCCTSSGMQNL